MRTEKGERKEGLCYLLLSLQLFAEQLLLSAVQLPLETFQLFLKHLKKKKESVSK